MATENYDHCLEMVLHHEGGYVDHPDDPGGETNMGITKRVWEEWGGEKDMIDLEVEDVMPIYRENYWDRVKGDHLPSGLDLCVFDFGVNAGTGRAAKLLQKLVGATPDGAIGPNTLAKVDNFVSQETLEGTITEYQHQRQRYYESLKHFETFGRGWTRRNDETLEAALNMI